MDYQIIADSHNKGTIGLPLQLPDFVRAAEKNEHAEILAEFDGDYYHLMMVPIYTPELSKWMITAIRQKNTIKQLESILPHSIHLSFNYQISHNNWKIVATNLNTTDAKAFSQKLNSTTILHKLQLNSAEFLQQKITQLNTSSLNPIQLVAHYSMVDYEKSMNHLMRIMLSSLSASLLLIFIGSHFITRKVAKPVISIAAANQRGLEIIAASGDMLKQQQSLNTFSHQVLSQIDQLIEAAADKMILFLCEDKSNSIEVLSGNGKFKELSGKVLQEDFYRYLEITDVLNKQNSQFNEDSTILAIPLLSINKKICLYIDKQHQNTKEQQIMIEAYTGKLASAYDNMFLFKEINDVNQTLEKRVQNRTKALEKLNEELEKISLTNPLTNIWNRRYFINFAEKIFLQSKRYGTDLSIILLGIDNFKTINDTYGHNIGDKALCQISAACCNSVRKSDVVARFGGEEFVVLTPGFKLTEAMGLAERMRETIANTIISLGHCNIKVSASLGVAAFSPQYSSIDDLIKVADEAMYTAKKTGKNKVVAL